VIVGSPGRTRYKVVEEVGRGGMGRVLRAYDPKLQREVALKEVRSKLLGAELSRRLVAEARAMAKLAHPNVVAVYDVEELEHGEVVLVMEYVAGRTLGAWLETPRTWQEIVACFRLAGRGLAAAHAAGLLHRDFKPDNVLIGADDMVKVTDFGLAKVGATDSGASASQSMNEGVPPPGSSSEGLTKTGVVLGTPRYMAPEQHRGESLTPAADQYSYCVALWIALTGSPPFDRTGPYRIERAKELGPPDWPGGPTPPAIVAAIRRGLAPDPGARWADMHELLAALAVDPARRRRRWVQIAAGVGALGLAGLAVHAWGTARAARCTDAAAREHLEGAWGDSRRAEVRAAVLGVGATYATEVATRTDEALDQYASAWTRMHVETCEATTVRGEQSAAVMDLRMACLHRAKVELGAVASVLAGADASTVPKAHEVVASLRPLARCADIDALQADVEPPLPEESEAVEYVRTRLALCRAALKAVRNDEARSALDSARERVADVQYGPVHAELANTHGLVLERMGEYEESRVQLEEALRLASKWRQWSEMRDAATTLILVVGHRLRRFDEGMRYAEIAEGLAEGDPVREAAVARTISIVLCEQGEYVEAEAYGRRSLALLEALPDADPIEVAWTRNALATALDLQGKLDEAIAEHDRVLALLEPMLGSDHPHLGYTRLNLAAVYYTQGKFLDSEASCRRSIAILETSMGAEHPQVAAARSSLATILDAQGKFAEAEVEHRRALAVQERVLGPDHPSTALARHNLAVTLRVEGKLEESEAEHRRALAVQERVLGPDHPHVAASHDNLAAVLFAQGKAAEAEAEYRRALALLEASLGADHPDVAPLRTRLARVLLARDEYDEARALAEAAWRLQEHADRSTALRGDTAFVLARVYWADGDAQQRARALELADRALADFNASMDAKEATAVTQWLATHRPR
jgi:eukaryotic-like serine/threonine-protein kinase